MFCKKCHKMVTKEVLSIDKIDKYCACSRANIVKTTAG